MEMYNNWQEEKRSAYLYGVMAAHEENFLHKKLFLDLQVAAEKQAELWARRMQDANGAIPTSFKPNFRCRLIASLVKLFGTENLHFILSAMKIRGMSIFNRYHNEHKHTSLNSASNLRAAVFGVNDGLISNMSLILGMAGANSNQHYIIIAGIAGLLAGAFSMGAGEYISVRSQRDVFEHQIAIEKQELAEYPEEEQEELSLIYQARGIPATQANTLAKIMIDNPETGLNTLAREELGLNPDDLVSPFGAMLSSFFSFSIGALLPILPFFFMEELQATFIVSIVITAATLFVIGAVLSLFTNRNPLLMGLRMLGIGFLAGAATFVIGKFLGTTML